MASSSADKVPSVSQHGHPCLGNGMEMFAMQLLSVSSFSSRSGSSVKGSSVKAIYEELRNPLKGSCFYITVSASTG